MTVNKVTRLHHRPKLLPWSGWNEHGELVKGVRDARDQIPDNITTDPALGALRRIQADRKFAAGPSYVEQWRRLRPR